MDSITDSFIGFLKGESSVVSYDIGEYKKELIMVLTSILEIRMCT